ncbi:MAG: hypothetical protein ACD_22C00180G0005 [uncultured bacterium]|nr:MAG: hypothetical protein ACD_22C00180G0005 [uncultured bacterium]
MKLSTVAPIVRKSIVGVLLFVVGYYIFTLAVLPFAKVYWYKVFPSKYAPTVLYGKLDPLEFVEKQIVITTPTYVLNTKTGKLPTLPTVLPVYRFMPVTFSYADTTNAQRNAAVLGFTDNDLISDLKVSIYKWRSPVSGGVLEIPIHTRELVLTTPLVGKHSLFQAGTLSQSTAAAYAKSLFTQLGRFDDPLYKAGSSIVSLGSFVGQRIVGTENVKDAQLARVDLFRFINKIPIYGPDPKKGLLHVWLRTPLPEYAVYNYPVVEAYYWPVEQQSNATYPLIPLSGVWKEIAKGNGIVANVTPKSANPFEDYQAAKVDKILINNIYIAYYDTPKQQKYMQPIYVFEGNYTSNDGGSGSITFYYPAISGQWTNSVTPAE